MSLASLNPKNAQPRSVTHVARCVENVVEADAPLQVKEAWKFSDLGQQVPFWRLKFEALDTQWPDGPYFIEFSTVLVTPEGKPLDNSSNAHTVAQAFAGLGITIFPDPDDPQYDESAVVNNCFEIEMVPVPRSKKNRRFPVPTAILGPDFKYQGQVFVRTPRASEGVEVSAGGTPVTVDLAQDTTARQRLLAALESVDTTDEDAVLDAIRDAGIKGATLGGTSVLNLAMQGKLVAALAEVGGDE